MSRNHKKVVEYRNYYLPNNFPVLLLTGPKWIISPVASSTLHFHNCLELGYCHEGSGTLEFGNGKFFLIGDAIEGQYVANNLHFAAAIAFILMLILLAAMALMKRGTNKRVYGGV